MRELYIGLMSGTSLDGLDVVLVDFTNPQPQLIAHHAEAFPSALHAELSRLLQPGTDEINRLGIADRQLGILSATAVNQLLAAGQMTPQAIRAIGSHGQTIRHAPQGAFPFTVQIGDPNTIAALTHITTVADFRRRDIAVGGQGAPLAPAFHQAFFHSDKQDRIVLNLGGIANITWLSHERNATVIGFDTGPANILLDTWIKQHHNKNFDASGQWAASGHVDEKLLQFMLTDPYFARSYPKSTGREYFNLDWINHYLHRYSHTINPVDVQATLCELTAITIANAIRTMSANSVELFVCGGGANNDYLIARLKQHCKKDSIAFTSELGIDPQHVEAMAFAWFAKQTLEHKPGNLPSVTGANEYVVLGGIYP